MLNLYFFWIWNWFQGVEPHLRNEVWKFLLGYYKWDSTYKSRTEERKQKVWDLKLFESLFHIYLFEWNKSISVRVYFQWIPSSAFKLCDWLIVHSVNDIWHIVKMSVCKFSSWVPVLLAVVWRCLYFLHAVMTIFEWSFSGNRSTKTNSHASVSSETEKV